MQILNFRPDDRRAYGYDTSAVFPPPPLRILAVLGIALIALAVAIVVVAAQTTPPPPDTTVNIGPLIIRLFEAVRPIIDTGIVWGVGGIVGFVAIAYNRVLGRQLEEQHRKTLELAINNGVMLAVDKVIEAIETRADITIDVKYEWIATLIRPYVETSAPDAIAALGVTDAKLVEKIEAQVNAVILAAKTGGQVVVGAAAAPAAASA